MRITNSILRRDTLSALARKQSDMSRAHAEVSSGLRIRAVSDDPSDAAAVLRADGSLRALGQYRRNIGEARARLDAEEVVLDRLSTTLERARELGTAAGMPLDAGARAALAAEARTLLAQVVQLSATTFEGEYLFGGAQGDTAPIQSDGTVDLLVSTTRQTEIGRGQLIESSHDARAVFVDSGALAAVQTLVQTLETPGASPDTALTALTAAHDAVQGVLGETGARAAALEGADANLESLEVSLQSYRADRSEADLEEAITTLVNRQVAYQAALSATSRIFETTLTDYLR